MHYEQKRQARGGPAGHLPGGLGIHKFYLGMKWWGLFYLLFCWTGIPAIVGFIEGIIYLFQSEEKFNQKYNSGLI